VSATPERQKEIRARLRAIRAEMKTQKIKRFSCFMGGHTPESYRLNAEIFRLETELKG
jgi:hypothetical protein